MENNDQITFSFDEADYRRSFYAFSSDLYCLMPFQNPYIQRLDSYKPAPPELVRDKNDRIYVFSGERTVSIFRQHFDKEIKILLQTKIIQTNELVNLLQVDSVVLIIDFDPDQKTYCLSRIDRAGNYNFPAVQQNYCFQDSLAL